MEQLLATFVEAGHDVRVRFPVVCAAAPWFAGHRVDAFERGVALLVENLRPSGKRRRGGC